MTAAARLLCLACLAALAQPLAAAEKKAEARKQSAAAQSELSDLRKRIESLRGDLAKSESSHADVSDQLKETERDISRSNRKLRELTRERDALAARVSSLNAQSRQLGSAAARQQQALEEMLLRHYQLSLTADPLRDALSGADPGQAERDAYYLAAIARSRGELVRELQVNLKQKQDHAEEARRQGESLARVEAEQRKARDQTLAKQEERKALLAKLEKRIKARRQEVSALQRDEKQLQKLIEGLSRIIAKKSPVRRPAAVAAPPTGREPAPEAFGDSAFARQRGHMSLPVRGEIAGRFGAPRGEGGTWKGLYIRAASGAEVHAVSAGRVVFSEWMRGFGNLLIVDHGGSFMSIYGYNESLLKQVGEAVKSGEAVATAGNSGGNAESGLYFEIRHEGRPIDPMKWLAGK